MMPAAARRMHVFLESVGKSATEILENSEEVGCEASTPCTTTNEQIQMVFVRVHNYPFVVRKQMFAQDSDLSICLDTNSCTRF